MFALDEVKLFGAGGLDGGRGSRGLLGTAGAGREVAAAEEGSEGEHRQLKYEGDTLVSISR